MTKPRSAHRPRRIWSGFALLAGAALLLSGCGSGGSKHGTPTVGGPQSGGQSGQSGQSTPASSGAPSSSAPPSSTAPVGKPVHIKANIADGTERGVGMPVIATFQVKITDGVAFQQATKTTVNGAPANGAWYFEYSDPASGHLMEAHYRLQHYWLAHATIHMDIATKGLSAGKGLVFDNSLTLDFGTTASHVLTVDDSTHKMTVLTDGKVYGVFPISLGANNTPTKKGIKVIMDKGADVRMVGPTYDDPHVKFTQRLTYSGEYLHAAPWNCTSGPHCVGPLNNIGHADSSNGCTNMLPADAEKLFGYLGIGDVVMYTNIAAPKSKKMQLGNGYGDWNLTWPLWQTGGAIHTH